MENVQTNCVKYTWEQIETALQGIPTDFQIRFKNAIKFPCEFIAIKSMEDWKQYADGGKYLWAIIAPKGLHFGTSITGETFKVGRRPKNDRIFGNTDGTILMFVIKYIDSTGKSQYLPNLEDPRFNAKFVNTIFKRLNNELVAVPTISDIKEDLQLSDTIINLDSWQLTDEQFNQLNDTFNKIEINAIEDAYSGVITYLPKTYNEIKSKIDWILNINTALEYDFPEGIATLSEYISKVKQVLTIAIIKMKSKAQLPISNDETMYLTAASTPQEIKVVELVKPVNVQESKEEVLDKLFSNTATQPILGRGSTIVPTPEAIPEVLEAKVELGSTEPVQLSIPFEVPNKDEVVADVPRPETAIPINATMVSIDPETHKVTTESVPITTAPDQSHSISNIQTLKEASPEQVAHNINTNLAEVNALADELEAFVNLDQFKGQI